ncbi:MAG: hypothetical protein WBB01_12890 [Phormidesmis sp.]
MQPSSQQPFQAHYKTTLAVFFWVSGSVGFILSLWLLTSVQMTFLLAAASILWFLVGFYYLRRPYFLLEPCQLTVYNLFGLVTKRYTFVSWEVVKADDRRIYIDDGGITKKVPVAPWLAKTDDWLAMRKLL